MIEKSKHYLLIVDHFPWGLRRHFVDKGQYNQSYGFSGNHIRVWELDPKAEWTLKKCFLTVVLERALERPLDSKEIKPVSPKGNQPWIFIGRIDTEVEALILDWPPDAKSWLIRKDPDAEQDWAPRGEGGDRGRDGWMASPTQWTWVWASSGRQRRMGKPGVLPSVGSHRVGHDWATEQQQGLKNAFSQKWIPEAICLITASQTPSNPVFSLYRWQNWGPQRRKLYWRPCWTWAAGSQDPLTLFLAHCRFCWHGCCGWLANPIGSLGICSQLMRVSHFPGTDEIQSNYPSCVMVSQTHFCRVTTLFRMSDAGWRPANAPVVFG